MAQCLPTEIQFFSAEQRMEDGGIWRLGWEWGWREERRERAIFTSLFCAGKGGGMGLEYYEWFFPGLVQCVGWVEGSREQGEQQVRDLIQVRMTGSNP